MKLYRKRSYIYYEDGTEKYYVHPARVGVKVLSATRIELMIDIPAGTAKLENLAIANIQNQAGTAYSSAEALVKNLSTHVDEVTQATTTISYEHHAVHDSEMFAVGYETEENNGGTNEIIITTPDNGKWQHIEPFAEALDGQALVTIFEGVTYTGGTTLTPRNRNRNGADNWSGTVVHTPATVSTAGAT